MLSLPERRPTMDSRPETNDERERRDRAALCRALVEIVASDGLHAATPNAISDRAELPSEAFYSQFESVHECFAAVYDDTVERLHGAVDEAIAAAEVEPGAEGWHHVLEAGFGAALQFLANDPALARVLVVEGLSAGADVRARREAAIESFLACLDSLRRERAAPVPPLAPELIVRGTDDLIYSRVARGESERLEDLLPGLRYMWLVPFVGRYRATDASEAADEDRDADENP
jgi:AcrR family transcriptional regulator